MTFWSHCLRNLASVFMQDGAPCYTIKSVCKWLDDCVVPFFNDWPGNFLIDTLWLLMKRLPYPRLRKPSGVFGRI